jgi:hypothetical protein
MTDVVAINKETDLPANQILQSAILDPSLDIVIVIGRDQNGSLYFASSTTHAGEMTLLLKRAERHILDLILEQFP